MAQKRDSRQKLTLEGKDLMLQRQLLFVALAVDGGM